MSDKGETIQTFELMPRPASAEDFSTWLVPARNNIQREMLRLRPILLCPPIVGFPFWVARARHLAAGACFSLWRSVFQARMTPLDTIIPKDGLKFLDQLIANNAATYQTELNGWSLEFYIENAVYRLREARDLALSNGVAESAIPTVHMLGKSENEDRDMVFRLEAFTPYGEWEECFLATRALITAMDRAIVEAR